MKKKKFNKKYKTYENKPNKNRKIQLLCCSGDNLNAYIIMEKLTLEHLAPYLPYGLKCQYQGIINGKEISKKRKEFEKENTPFTNWEYYEPIQEIKGLKIAPLKSIRVYKKYWVANCGIYNNGQKSFYNGIGIKPILRPLSDLTKEIEANGEKLNISKMLETKCIMSDFDLKEWIETITESMPLSDWNLLFKHHFDAFNLIPNGLAININELNK